MQFTIALTPERFKELLREAYEDGWEDGRLGDAPMTDAEWQDSVTLDRADALITRVRNGGNP